MYLFRSLSKKRATAQGFQSKKAPQKPQLQAFILEPILTPSGVVDSPDTPDVVVMDFEQLDTSGIDIDFDVDDTDLSAQSVPELEIPDEDLEPVDFIYDVDTQDLGSESVPDVAVPNETLEPVGFIDNIAEQDLGIETPDGNLEPVDFIDNAGLADDLIPLTEPSPTFESGVFTVGDTGNVSVDFLFDGGKYQGEFAIFSLDGMDEFEPGSQAFIQEAARRGLSDSPLGYVVISDPIEGARFSSQLNESNWNEGAYQGVKTFNMRPGDTFGVMLVPNGTVQQMLDNPSAEGDLRPLFSMATSNPDDAFHVGQIADVTGDGNTFVMEDLRADTGSDHDYNDVIFQVRGAKGTAVDLDNVIDSAHDWRNSDMGQALIDYAEPYVTPDTPNSGAAVAENPVDDSGVAAQTPPPTDNGDVVVTQPSEPEQFEFLPENQPLVGIIDTGVSANNPDLNYSNIILGTDYVDGDDNPLLEPGEGNEHGTHVLGIISTTQDNGIGIDGVNDEAPIWVGRAVGSGQWTESLVEFVNVARDSQQPNAVVNLSLDLTQVNPDGSVTTRYEFTPQERAAIEYARQYNVLIVAAAGNDGGVMSVLGQASQEFDNIITVGSAQDFDSTLAPAQGFNRADYSSYGYGLDIMANGATIDQPVLSTVGDGVGTMAGTSVATAQVTGAVSQVWAANPQLSYRQVIEIIKSTATDLDTPNWDVITGAGLLNLNAAVLLAKVTTPQEYEVPATVIPETWSGEGRVTPSERAAAVPMWPTVEPTSFTGRVMATAGANVRSGPGTSFSRVGSRGYNSSVTFDGWTYGERITDIALGTPDERWYRIAGTNQNQWIASAIIDGNAPGSTPLPPGNSVGGGTPLPPSQPNVPIDGNSPNYRNGNVNPFARNPYLIGQCTWYAYGRMLETGLLPAGAKANGWFLGNAEAWRRDAARAGLPVSSTPTPGARGLVVWPPGVRGGNKKYGHVAFLEEVYPDGRIRISESNWDGKGISERTLTPAQYSGLAFVRLENATPTPSFSSPPAQPGKQREYRVRPADTLSGIAYRELGNANRWREITKADGSTFTEAEARRLQVGMSVYLPVSYQTKPTNSSGGIIVEPISFIPPFIPLPRPGTFDPKSPKGYDRSSAVRYAKEYADNKGNPKYHYFEYYEKCLINWPVPLFCNWVGGDCTNFVSQCLIEGGVLSLKEATEKEEGGKIYLKNTFTVVDKLIDHLLKNKLASDWDVWNLKPNEKFDKISQLLHPGDIIAFELNNDPNSPRDHLAVFMGYQTDKDGKRIAMGANHTLDGIRPIPLDKVRSLIRIDDSLGFNWV